MVTCPLVPDVPHLISGSCSSPRIFGLGFLQTPPRDDALALLLTLGSTNTWYGDSHPTSYGPCPAHTTGMCCVTKNAHSFRYRQLLEERPKPIVIAKRSRQHDAKVRPKYYAQNQRQPPTPLNFETTVITVLFYRNVRHQNAIFHDNLTVYF